MSDEKCQQCGADKVKQPSNAAEVIWECGSWRLYGEDRVRVSYDCLRRQLAAKDAEIALLWGKWPKTADGVRPMIGDAVWFYNMDKKLCRDLFNGFHWHPYGYVAVLNENEAGPRLFILVEHAYSTEAAALAARAGQETGR